MNKADSVGAENKEYSGKEFRKIHVRSKPVYDFLKGFLIL